MDYVWIVYGDVWVEDGRWCCVEDEVGCVGERSGECHKLK
jgi:hypothetical protein